MRRGPLGGPFCLDTEDQVIDVETLPALISVPRAAELIGLSRASAYRFAASGDLPTRRLGGRVYVVTSRLMSFINDDSAVA
jgi:predicted DNA-binding transcriptional regulator AlpA